MSNLIKLTALIFLLAIPGIAQSVTEKNATEEKDKLQKEAVSFLRETLGDVNGMRTLENRISFASEIAGLMWFHDEREARAMYNSVIGDFRDLVAKYDGQMNGIGEPTGDGDGIGYSMMAEPSEKQRITRRFGIAMGVRQQIAMSIAEHDADLAFSFYYDVLTSVSNAELRRQFENRDTYFEFQLLNQLAETNADKTVKYAGRSLAKGVEYQHIELLRKVHAKNPDKGAELGALILGRFKTDKLLSSNLYILSSIIDLGESTYEASRKPGGKRPIYTQAELRELAEIMAQAILNQDPGDEPSWSYVETIKKYSPGRAAQIRTKFKVSASGPSYANRSVANAMNAASNAAYAYGTSNSASNVHDGPDAAAAEREERARAEKKAMDDLQSLGNKALPKEERDKIIAQVRKIIMQTPGRDKKIISLGGLAAQVAYLGDKELASEIMRDAERIVNPAPRNYQEFMLTWMLASGYAMSDPDKAFPILEDVISRANETLSAFVKVGEFIDVQEEMIQDGEVQVGVFGGQMVRGLTNELTMADTTIQMLARADFAKTKALTNRFDRPEIRVLSKMMVLRAILKPVKARQPEETIPGEPNAEPEN